MSYLWTLNPEMEAASSLNFSNRKERITFARKEYPLYYHSIAGKRWQHMQDMIRIPDDAQGNRCFMGTFSQNVSDGEGRMMFAARTRPGSSSGEVIWMDELNNKSLAGGFNHPGDLRRVGFMVVTAGQNWDSPANYIPFADSMNRGNGGQTILFYSVFNPASPIYVGRLSTFLHNGNWVTLDTDIDTITVIKNDDDGYYYLAFNGIRSTGGLVCRSKYLNSNTVWISVKTGNLESQNPIRWKNNALLAGRANDGHIRYTHFLGNHCCDSKDPIPPSAFGDGTTFSVSTLPNGKSHAVYANVESDGNIEIEQIEST